MFELYIANKNYSSWSLRPWILMKTLGIPFEEHLVPFSNVPAERPFLRFSPTGKVPCLVDNGWVVWDSLGIVEYLAERHPQVWPTDALARAWARCATAEMHSSFQALRSACSMTVGLRVQLHTVSPALKAELERLDQLWSDGLSRFGGPFLAGSQFSAVDAFFAPVAFRIQSYQLALSPASMAYAHRLLSLDGMKTWETAALQEPWRDEPHERETHEAGIVLADLRVPAQEGA